VKTAAGRAYSREVRIRKCSALKRTSHASIGLTYVADNDSTKLRFAGGAEYGQTGPSQILVTIIDLEKALGK